MTGQPTPEASGEARRVCRDYFDAFLPTFVDRPLLPGLRELNCCFEVLISDVSAEPWRLVIEGGRLSYVGHDGPGTADCRYILDAETAYEIIRVDCAPQDAFLAGDIDLEGDMELGLTLSTVLEPFLQRFRYSP